MIKVLKMLGLWLVHALLGLATVVAGAVVLVEWFSGCGETYIDAKGIRHTHECLFLPQQNTTKGHKTSQNT